MKLLDTTFLIHYWGGRDAVEAYLEAHDDEAFITTTLNIKELAVGRAMQGELSPHEIRATFEWVNILPFRAAHAFTAGELEAQLHSDDTINQETINSLAGDLLIAAVAKDVGAPVVTRNTADFEMFEGVAVETY